MDQIDIQKLSLDSNNTRNTKTQKPPRHKKGELFLKGPIPWNWLLAASKQKGKALHIAIGIRFLEGLKRTKIIVLKSKLLRDLGVNRCSAYRGLKTLEKARLIEVKRHIGRLPMITILDNPKDG